MGRPRKPEEEKDDTISVTLRFPRELHGALSKRATADERSLNLYVMRVLRGHIEGDTAEPAAPHGKARR